MCRYNVLLTSNINAVMKAQKKLNNFINIQPLLNLPKESIKLMFVMVGDTQQNMKIS